MPPFGLLLGGVTFTNLTLMMKNIYKGKPPVPFRYGSFLEHVIYLLIMSFVLFCIILIVTKLRDMVTRKDAEYAPLPEPTEEVKVLMEIRELLANRAPIKT